MIDRKFTFFVGFPAYSGNGGYSAILPQIMYWWKNTYHKMRSDPQVHLIHECTYRDTPITMVRNQMVLHARRAQADYLLMVDSDNAPDIEPDGKPFWDTSWEFLKKHYEKGPALIFAPYCGTPEYEAAYVFKWTNHSNEDQPEKFKLDMMTREEASLWSGIVDVAAGPTGLMLIDMRMFDLVDAPYFCYEYKDFTESEKDTTEDVYFTRNVSMNGIIKLGYNPVYCNFDAWAGHAKQKMVRKPRPLAASNIAETLRHAVLGGKVLGETMVVLGDKSNRDETGQKAKPKPMNRLAVPINKHLYEGMPLSGPPAAPPDFRVGVTARPESQDPEVFREVCEENCYRLPDKFPEGAVIIDVGAQIGCFALECVKRGASQVICFEPEPENFKLLVENTRNTPRIMRVNGAIWRSDIDEKVRLYPAPPSHTASHRVGPTRNGEAIKSIGLDSYLTEPIHLLKLDCEGSELPILATSKKLHMVDQIICELHHSIPDHEGPWTTVQDCLTQAGFEFEVERNPKCKVLSVIFAKRKPTPKHPKLRSLVQELAYELGEQPRVVTIEPPDGTVAIELADAGAMVYTVRSELTQSFKDAAGERLGDTIDALIGDEVGWSRRFDAKAHLIYMNDCVGRCGGDWLGKASHVFCGNGFQMGYEQNVKSLPGEFRTEGDFWWKVIHTPIEAVVH